LQVNLKPPLNKIKIIFMTSLKDAENCFKKAQGNRKKVQDIMKALKVACITLIQQHVVCVRERERERLKGFKRKSCK
jgi:hypothetical protein